LRLDLASPTNENRVRGREENDRTEGRTTLLGKITGRNRTRSSSESRGALNSIGMVRGHMVQKTRIDRTVDYAGDDARSAGAPGEVTAVTADNQTALVGTDTEVAHPTSSGSGGREGSRNSLLGYLKRPFVRHTPPTSGQATALGATGNRGGISSDFFDRIRGGRAEPPEREKPVRDAVDKVVVVDVETEEITTGPQNEPVTVKTEEHTVVNVRGAETETSIKEEESSHEIFIDTRAGIAPPVINIPAEGEVVVQTTVTKTVTTIEETSSKDVPRDIRNENGEIPTGTTTGETSEGYVPGPATSNRTPAKDPLPEEVTSGSTKGNEKADLQFTSGDITTRNTTEINEEAGEGSRHQGIGFSHVVTNRNTFEGDEDQELRGKLDGDVPIARESKFHEEL